MAPIRGSEVPAMHPVRPVGGPMKSKEKSLRPAGGPIKSQEEAITPGVAVSFISAFSLALDRASCSYFYWRRRRLLEVDKRP